MHRMRMKRYGSFPLTLYRCQWAQVPVLREYEAQKTIGSTSFDFRLGDNNLYNPAIGDKYLGPNGLSMRPMGPNLAEFMDTFTGRYIYQLPAGILVPPQFVLIHQRSDHFSLQTRASIIPEEFCLKVNDFFKQRKRLTIFELKERIKKEMLKGI